MAKIAKIDAAKISFLKVQNTCLPAAKKEILTKLLKFNQNADINLDKKLTLLKEPLRWKQKQIYSLEKMLFS